MANQRTQHNTSPFKKTLTRALLVLTLISSMAIPQTVRAEPMHEFIMSCAYGVLAGTLVGAASLAFTEKPGDNLNNIARGASLGLYAGIVLGLYVVYGVSSEEEQAVDRQTGGGASYHYHSPEAPRLLIAPTWSSQQQLSGAVAHVNVLSF
jgi:hypothetical protein